MKLYRMDLTKKIRKITWSPDNYLQADAAGEFYERDHKTRWFFTADELMSDLWDYFEEPKEKKVVKMWPAVIRVKSGYAITGNIYKSEEDAKNGFPLEYVRLATEITAIEMEE